jgi:hypothetical protein
MRSGIGDEYPSQPISRILYAGRAWLGRLVAIYLGCTLPCTSVQPTRSSKGAGHTLLSGGGLAPVWPCSWWGLPGRDCRQSRRWSLEPPFHPYRSDAPAVCFLWHCAVGSPRLAVSQHHALWSPDFPHLFRDAATWPARVRLQYSASHPGCQAFGGISIASVKAIVKRGSLVSSTYSACAAMS